MISDQNERVNRLLNLRDLVSSGQQKAPLPEPENYDRSDPANPNYGMSQARSLGDVVAAGQMASNYAPMPDNSIRNNTTGKMVPIGGIGGAGLPMNTMRNEATGAEYQFASSPRNKGPELDYSRPMIEIPGKGKGRWIKGENAAIIGDKRIDFGIDVEATQRAEDRALRLQSVKQQLESGGLGIEKQRVELDALRSNGGGKPLTESQGKASGFAIRAEDADRLIREVGKNGEVQPGLIKRSLEAVPLIGESLGTIANVTQSPEQRQIEQAQRNFINAVLRQESGAAIAESEFNNARKQYFPQPGDDAETIANKAANRQAAIAGFVTQAGPSGYERAKAEFEARKSRGGSASVTLPDGRVVTFPSAAQADGFRKANNL